MSSQRPHAGASDRRLTEEELDHFFNLSLDLLCIADFNGHFIRLNPTWEDALGFTCEELMASPYVTFLHPDDIAPTNDVAKSISEGKPTLSFENRYRRKDGSYVWLLWNAKPDMERQVIYATARNITAFKKTQEALKESEERLRLAMEVANIGVWEWDIKGGTVIWDSGMFALYGLPPRADGKVQYTDWRNRVMPDEVAEQEARLQNTAAICGRDHREFHIVRASDNSIRVVQAAEMVIPGHDGQAARMVGINMDITDQRRAEADLLRSNRDLEQFAYVASHDLQEPLRMVTSYLQLLERRHAPSLNDEAKSFIVTAVDGAQRMRSLILDLLAYSRLGTQGRPMTPTDCEKVVTTALQDLVMTIGESHARITRGALPTVIADETQLRQLFQNLIGNAIKFRGTRPPEIHLSAERSGSQWIFRVQDNGIGIRPDFYERIFVIFQRLHTREEYPGTGIGLALCRRIVERHGGRIWVESEIGKGTSFLFSLSGEVAEVGV